MSESGRFRSVRFRARKLPVGFEERARRQQSLNVATWWIADRPLIGTPMAIADIAQHRRSRSRWRNGQTVSGQRDRRPPLAGCHIVMQVDKARQASAHCRG